MTLKEYLELLAKQRELFTPEMKNDYIEWCKTDEGAQYLVGGSKYIPEK